MSWVWDRFTISASRVDNEFRFVLWDRDVVVRAFETAELARAAAVLLRQANPKGSK